MRRTINKKIFLYCIAALIAVNYIDAANADILEKIFWWTIVPCDKADDVAREGIQQFYHNNKIAVKRLEKAVKSCVDNDEYVYNLGVAYYKTGKLKKAVSMFKEAIRLNNSFKEAKRALAWILVTGKLDIDKGMDMAMSLLKRENDALLFYIVEYGHKLKGNDDERKKWFKKASKRSLEENKINIDQYMTVVENTKANPFLSERSGILYSEIGLLYESVRNYDLAIEYFKKANSSFGLWSLGRLYARNGDQQKANEYFKMALDFSSELNSDDVKAIKSDIKNRNNPLYFKKDIINFIYPEEFISIPAGEFKMGTSDGPKIEQPEHSVFIDTFLIGKYEVTNIEYKIYIDSTGYISPYNCCKAKYDIWNKIRIPAEIVNKPVVNVSWHDAVRYIGWKNKRFGKKYRLPTEAEWEKAARGVDGRKYPWGDASPTLKIAYFSRHWDGLNTFVDVTSYENGKSPYGAHNMAGSVWEWCYDWFRKDYYKKMHKRNPRGPHKGEFKVLRGGSWMNLSDYITATFRNRNWPDVRYNGAGFRLAADL